MKHSLLYPLLILAISPFAEGATTRTWTGFGTTGNWNTATNWSGTAVPVAGDDLVFPPTNLHLTNTNYLLAGTTFNSVTLSGSNYVVTANSITLTAGLTNNGPAGTTNNFLTIALATNQIFRCASNSTLILPVTSLGTNTLTFDCSGSILVNGAIFGNGSIEKTGAGLLVLAATNTYTGSTTVSQGTVRVQTAAALGATSGSTTVAAGAILELQNNITVAAPITLTGTLRNAAGTNLLSGAISLTATNSTVLTETNTSLTLSNVLSGAGGLVKTGPGLLTLAGTNANTYSGATLVNEGTLLLNKSMNITALPGLLVIGDSIGGANADIVRLAADNQIQAASSNVFTINSSGLLDLNDKNQGVGPLAGPGNISLGSSSFAALTIIAEDV